MLQTGNATKRSSCQDNFNIPSTYIIINIKIGPAWICTNQFIIYIILALVFFINSLPQKQIMILIKSLLWCTCLVKYHGNYVLYKKLTASNIWTLSYSVCKGVKRYSVNLITLFLCLQAAAPNFQKNHQNFLNYYSRSNPQ